MTGSKVREKRQKKVQIELKCGYYGEVPQLVVSLMPKQVTPILDGAVACLGLPRTELLSREAVHLLASSSGRTYA